MARASLEAAKIAVGNLMAEHERDREFVQGMLNHTVKMTDQLAVMREHEERKIDEEAAERKVEVRRLFNQMLTLESERQERLERYLADLEGQVDTTTDYEQPVENGESVAMAS